MKTKIGLLCIFGLFFLSGCAGNRPESTPIAVSITHIISATDIRLSETYELTATPTSVSTPIPWQNPTPETLYGYPTPEPAALPTCDPVAGCMLNLTPDVQQKELSFHELYVGKYVLRKWCNNDSDLPSLTLCGVTISSSGTEQIEVWGYPARFGKETGADLNGDGISDVVIINWPGGNSSVETIIYEAGDHLEKVMDIWSYRVGTFTDLNGDGINEYIAPYRNASRSFSQCTLWTSVVYEYQPAQGDYVPATHKYKDVLEDRIQWASNFLYEFTTENPEISFHFLSPGYPDNPNVEDKAYLEYEDKYPDYSLAVNALYELAAYYLLIGDEPSAKNVLDTYFSAKKAEEYLLAITNDIEKYLVP